MNKLSRKGFTLVELLAVIVVLSLVIVIVATKGFGAFDNAKDKITSMNENAIKEATEIVKLDIEHCDDSNDELLDMFGVHNCSELYTSLEGGTSISLDKMIEKNYISGADIEEIKKDKSYTFTFTKDGDNITVVPKKEDTTITLYLDVVNGNDSNDGTSIETALKTYEKLIEKAGTSKNIIIKLNEDYIFEMPTNMHEKVSFSSADGAEHKIIYNFQYSGEEKNFEVISGQYILEVWGAQGGYRNNTSYGGKGGYSKGTINLENNTQLFVYVGGAGGNGTTGCGTTICTGGFNGGGYRYKYYGGGGASDIRVGSNSIYSRVIVAGGGGSDGASNKKGMYGGGLSGGISTEYFSSCSSYCGKGGTQTYSGNSPEYTVTEQVTTGLISNTLANYGGGFAFGGGGIYKDNGYGGAGGGGWYGGSGTAPDGSGDDDRGGGGGSGYVYTESTAMNYPSGCLLNDDYYLTNAETIAGNTNFLSPNGESETGHSGNGYARITLIVK